MSIFISVIRKTINSTQLLVVFDYLLVSPISHSNTTDANGFYPTLFFSLLEVIFIWGLIEIFQILDCFYVKYLTHPPVGVPGGLTILFFIKAVNHICSEFRWNCSRRSRIMLENIHMRTQTHTHTLIRWELLCDRRTSNIVRNLVSYSLVVSFTSVCGPVEMRPTVCW